MYRLLREGSMSISKVMGAYVLGVDLVWKPPPPAWRCAGAESCEELPNNIPPHCACASAPPEPISATGGFDPTLGEKGDACTAANANRINPNATYVCMLENTLRNGTMILM